mmetsp:Transcript_61374/g.151049  ORF Transcript_61374/g.151049 Transcript_61374/m.151049 type:complete len:306 (-) Transcript_61374:351-1268(-)
MQCDFADLRAVSPSEPSPLLCLSSGRKATGKGARALAPRKTSATKKSVARTGGKIVYPRRKAGENPLDQRTPVIITLELLQEHFGTPLHVAAAKLGICATALKRVCRKVGIPKWPFRETRIGVHAGQDAGSSSDHAAHDVTSPATCSSSDTESLPAEEAPSFHAHVNTRATSRAAAGSYVAPCPAEEQPQQQEFVTMPVKPERKLAATEDWRPELAIYPYESVPATQARRSSLSYEFPQQWAATTDIDILSTEEEVIESDHEGPFSFMDHVNRGLGSQVGHSLDFLEEAMEAASQEAWSAMLPVC